MIYSYLVPMESSSGHMAALWRNAAAQGSLTQELVILVILVVIALALILVCGVMGRRAEDEAGPAMEGRAVEPAPVKPVAAVPAAAGVAAVAGEKEEEPEVIAERVEDAAVEPGFQQEAETAAVAEDAAVFAEPVEEAVVEPETQPEAVAAAVSVEEEPAAAEEDAQEALPPASVAPPEPDDLKRIEGIGPKVSSLLNADGIFTFSQLAETDVARLRRIVDEAGLRMMEPASWPEQAALAASGDWSALDKLQEQLKGGRRRS